MNGELYCPIWLKIFAPILFVIETILGICMNMTVLLTPVVKKHIHGNFFVKDLATSNLLVSICVPPLLTVAVVLPAFKFHLFVILEGLMCFTIVSNCVCVTCISIDRYVSIVKLDKMDRSTLYPRIVIWFLSVFGFSLPFGAYTVLDTDDMQDCYIFQCRRLLYALKPHFLYELYYTTIFVFSSITVIWCYKSVYTVAIKRIKIRIQVTGSKTEFLLNLAKIQRFRRVTKITVCITLSFLFCWMPLVVVSWVPIFESEGDKNGRVAHVLAVIIAMLTNILNPILYTFVRPVPQLRARIKREYVQVIRKSSKITPHTGLVAQTSYAVAKTTQLIVPQQDHPTSSTTGSMVERNILSDFHSTDIVSVRNITNHFDDGSENSQ